MRRNVSCIQSVPLIVDLKSSWNTKLRVAPSLRFRRSIEIPWAGVSPATNESSLFVCIKTHVALSSGGSTIYGWMPRYVYLRYYIYPQGLESHQSLHVLTERSHHPNDFLTVF